jgi:PadR family transcriptional regulator PadR
MHMTGSRMTVPTALILTAMVEGPRYGFDIMDATGLPSGTVYPALRRLEGNGCLRSNWEPAQAALDAGRPRRRVYEMSAAGAALLPSARAKLSSLPGFAGGRLRPTEG